MIISRFGDVGMLCYGYSVGRVSWSWHPLVLKRIHCVAELCHD